MIDNFSAANSALSNLMMMGKFAGLPDALSEKLMSVVNSPIQPEKVANFLEVVYANADEFNDDVKAVAIDIGNFALGYGFFGLGENQRGSKMIAVLNGETVEDAPEPLASMVIDTVEPELPEPIQPSTE